MELGLGWSAVTAGRHRVGPTGDDEATQGGRGRAQAPLRFTYGEWP